MQAICIGININLCLRNFLCMQLPGAHVGFNHRFLAPSPSLPSPLPGTGRREMTFQFFFSTSCSLHTFSGPLAQTPSLTQKPPKQFWQKDEWFLRSYNCCTALFSSLQESLQEFSLCAHHTSQIVHPLSCGMFFCIERTSV